MKTCKQCGSHAINPSLYGRDGTDLDLCDVHYWQKRAYDRGQLLQNISVFMQMLPDDLGRGSLNGMKVQLQHGIEEVKNG